MGGDRTCGEQLSGVPRKQDEMPKYPLLPGKECQAADGRLPQKAAPPKEKSTLPGALFIWGGWSVWIVTHNSPTEREGAFVGEP